LLVIAAQLRRPAMLGSAGWDGLMPLEGREAVIARARLLEFLKFRVLAAQNDFFAGDQDPAALRAWLAGLWPQACQLSDADLLLTFAQARQLYTEAPPRGGP
jgi:hypothetical protein